MLKRPITVQDLENGFEFEFDPEQQNNGSSEDEFNDEEYDMFTKDMTDIDGSKKPRYLGGSEILFPELKQTMTPLSEDGLILKEVLHNGIGEPIEDKSVAFINYAMYVEDRKEPFDSTWLRKRPYKFLLGYGSIITGLEVAVRSMKKGEVARFIVDPIYGYGKMGCPPRIPPDSEILLEVEIINFHLSKDAIEFEEMSLADQKKASFKQLTSVCNLELEVANGLFREKKYQPAIARYRKLMQRLEDAAAENEEDDIKRNQYLLKLYLNLSQSYIHMFNPKKAIIYADLALKLDPENTKGLYRMGHALHETKDFERALHYLNRAKRIKPHNKDINLKILMVEKNQRDHQDRERMFCKKMLGMNLNDGESKLTTLQESPEFINAIQEQLKAFVDSDEKDLAFSPGYTESQLEVVEVLSKEFNLEFVSKIYCDKRIIKVAKKKSKT